MGRSGYGLHSLIGNGGLLIQNQEGTIYVGSGDTVYLGFDSCPPNCGDGESVGELGGRKTTLAAIQPM